MYKINSKTGLLTLNGVTIPQDDSSELYGEYVEWLSNGGILTETDGLSQQELQEFAIQEEYEKYKKRRNDGVNAYLKISAELRLAKMGGMINDMEHRVIEATLEPARAEIVLGQWIGARQKLESIGTAIIGPTMYNDLMNRLVTYIENNY